MKVILTDITKEECEIVRQERNNHPEALRTSYFLTKEMQENFYESVICNRQSNNRFFAIRSKNGIFLGMCGIENIQWENRLGEISIILTVSSSDKYKEIIVDTLIEKAFNCLNLENIYGECYFFNPAINFWERVAKKYHAKDAMLENRKYYNGEYYNSLYFNINKIDFLEVKYESSMDAVKKVMNDTKFNYCSICNSELTQIGCLCDADLEQKLSKEDYEKLRGRFA